MSMNVFPQHTYVQHMHVCCLQKSEKGVECCGTRTTTWMLKTKPGFSERGTSAFNQWSTSPAWTTTT